MLPKTYWSDLQEVCTIVSHKPSVNTVLQRDALLGDKLAWNVVAQKSAV